jgi:hypothetical protein
MQNIHLSPRITILTLLDNCTQKKGPFVKNDPDSFYKNGAEGRNRTDTSAKLTGF